MKTILDIIPKEKNQTHNWLVCPNGKILLSKVGTIGRERGFFFVGVFKDKKEAIKFSGVKNPCFFNSVPVQLPWNKINFELYDYGHTNFWSVIENDDLKKNIKVDGNFRTSAHMLGLPKFIAVRCRTMDSAMQAIDEFCKCTGFKKGKVCIVHVTPSFDENGKEIPQG